ncbi:MAG: hypothetical protein ACK4VI_08975 [Alphaproteobacteria bacterium]
MKKYLLLIILGMGLLCIPAVALWAQGFGSKDKILNPYHQNFDPDQFRFEDYTVNICIRREILAKLFPVGTPKNFVDRVLVKAGGANAEKVPEHVGHNMYSYYKALEPPLVFMSSVWNVAVQFDDNMNVTDMSIGGGKSNSVYEYSKYCEKKHKYSKNWGVED